MEKGLKQFDKYIKPEDLIGSSIILSDEVEEDESKFRDNE